MVRRLQLEVGMLLAVRFIKRAIDLGASIVGIVLTAPLMAVIAVLIRLDSPGPAIYKQIRCGHLKRGVGSGVECEEFPIYKFRSMRFDAEKELGAVLASEGDARVTRIGRFLRKSRLDELPQLFNVLTGSMSLVGPRPERPALLKNLAATIPWFEERGREIKPGITGYSQINLGYTGKPFAGSEALEYLGDLTNPFGISAADGAIADEMRLKLLYDMAYVAACENLWTFLKMETKVIVATPLVMLRRVGR